jgi:hypothetical protein
VSYLASEVACSGSIAELQIATKLPPLPPSALAMRIYEVHVPHDKFTSIEDLFHEPYKLQHILTKAKYKSRREVLVNISPSIALCVDSCSCEGSVLITAMPKHENVTLDCADHMRERLRQRLGLSVPFIIPGKCHCNGLVDSSGYHLESGCHKGGKRTKTQVHSTHCTRIM